MKKNLTSITQLNRADIEGLIGLANRLSGNSSHGGVLRQKIIALLFFESSTRTRVGFEAATYKLAGHPITVTETKSHETMHGAETIEDTIKSIQDYCDLICIRSPDEAIFTKLEPILKKPVINCGNGNSEHPTQALIDLMTISSELGRLDDFTVAIVGNPRFSRAAHSLVLALSMFKQVKIRTISPAQLRFTNQYKRLLPGSGEDIEETTTMDLGDVDVVYVSGFPAKLPVGTFSVKEQNKYAIHEKSMANLKKEAIILCPLPRIDEIDTQVDDWPQAKYFEQSKNGLYMRMAVLKKMLS